MHSQFESLRERLLSAGVAPRYVGRYLTELSEHAADIAAEAERAGHPKPEDSALARLGKMDDLAQAMIDRKALQAWSVRAPWAAFLLAPSAALIVIDVVSIVATVALAKMVMPPAGVNPASTAPGWFAGLAAAINIFHAYILPPLLALGIALLATRQRMRMGARWPLVGLAAVACLAAAVQVHIDLPGPHRPGEVSLGVEHGSMVVFGAAQNLVLTMALYLGWRSLQSKSHQRDPA